MPFGASRAGLMSVAVDDIPDSKNLQAHFDFSDDSTTTSFVQDRSGNGNDLETGSFSGLDVDINGRQAANFNEESDPPRTEADVGFPLTVYAVIEHTGDTGNNAGYLNFDDSTFRRALRWRRTGEGDETGWNWSWQDGEQTDGNSLPYADDPVLLTNVISDDGLLRVNQGEDSDVGSASDANTDTITVGDRGMDNSAPIDANIGEILIYGTDHDESIYTDVENYLADKWGPF